jgi:DNA-3-methyladenine glycosylase
LERKHQNNIIPLPVPPHWNPLEESFYLRGNVVKIARDLLGKILITGFEPGLTAGRITETEAYNGVTDRASHAFQGRRTVRTEIMYRKGGYAYVYLCYGLHHLFNVVTSRAGIPHAVLIRSIEPVLGLEIMELRTGKKAAKGLIGKGPGNVSKALGIHTGHTGRNLFDQQIILAADGIRIPPGAIQTSGRIGVDYAGPDAALPYRFFLKSGLI